MSNSPPVCVVVPTRDRPEQLRRALRTIRSQDYPGLVACAVVFDQCEPDEAVASDDPHRPVLTLRNTRTPGLAGARNTGILAAEGDLVAFCDDDDEWLPSKLTHQAAALAYAPDALLATCGILVQYGGRVTARIPDEARLDVEGFVRDRMTEVHPSTFLFRRSGLLERVGLVDERLPGSYAEDYDLLLHTAAAGRIVSVPEPLVRVWWHRSSFFADRWATISDALDHLLDAHPEFDADPRGRARILGQRAFAEAARGNRRAALGLARRTFALHPGERRAALATVVALTPTDPGTFIGLAHRFGRGI
jgi:glycosyltransferase involved in cell wall biosynthesis